MNAWLHRVRLMLYAGTAFAWVIAFILTHLPPAEVPKTRIGDKLAHFIVYALLAGLLSLCLWARGTSIARSILIVLIAGLLYGAIDELTQPLVGRICSLQDWYADAAGTASAGVLFALLRLISPAGRSQPLEAPLPGRYD